MGGNANWKGLLLLGAALSFLLAAAASAEAPPLRAVRFEGDLPFSTSRAHDFVKPRLGRPFDSEAAQAAALRLRDACRRRHHPLAQVEWRLLPTARSSQPVILVFKVEPGPQGRLREVRFTGQRAFAARELSTLLSVRPRPGLWNRLLARDVLIFEELLKDQKALLRRYQQDGYAMAEIGGPKLEWVKSLDGFRLTWPILNEGPVYSIGYISLEATDLPTPSALQRILGLNAGECYDRLRVQAAIQRFEDYYRERGHAFASVEVQEDMSEHEARVDLLFVARPGTKPRLRAIRIDGNERTRDRIVLREIPLKPGDVFSAAALREAQAGIEMLPMFSQATVNYEGSSESPDFDLAVKVRERKTGRFEIGVAYGEVEGAVFQLNVFDDNLSLRPPFRGEALRGGLSLSAGQDILRFSARLRNPRVFSSQWSLDGDVYTEDSKYVSDFYNQRSFGGNLMLSHPLGRHHLVTTGYSVSSYDVYDVDAELLLKQPDADVDVFLTSWVVGWTMNLTDRLFRPTRGMRLSSRVGVGSRVLGGDTDAVQTSVGGSLYVSPFHDHVVSLRTGLDSVDPYGDTETVAMPLRRFLGGSGDLRGFGYKTVSPLDEEQDPLGGQSSWWASVEYLLPVLSWLDLAVYYDVGDVSLEAYGFSGEGPVSNWGIGVLIRADEFPVRFDFATPVETLEGDRNNEAGKAHYSFSMGYRF